MVVQCWRSVVGVCGSGQGKLMLGFVSVQIARQLMGGGLLVQCLCLV